MNVPYLSDTHCHLFDQDFKADILEVVQNSKQNGVQRVLVPNLDEHSVSEMFLLQKSFPDFYFPMLGYHPAYIKKDFQEKLDLIFKYKHEKIYGVGEIGLDYFHDTTFKQEQKIALEFQLNFAKEKQLPVSLHTRSATQDVITMVKNLKVNKGVFHCFGEDYETAKKIIDLGFHLGIGGVLTFKKSSLQEVLKKIPIEFVVFETDAPYLAPVPFRGKRNEPKYIKLIAEKYAEVCGVALEHVITQTAKNVRNVFGL